MRMVLIYFMKLADKVAIFTGSSSGIGKAIAKLLYKKEHMLL